MRICDDACRARGFVRPSFVDLSTGKRVPFGRRCNKLSYMSAEAMAAAFGGDPSYIPARIGFIYGYGKNSTMPSERPITRYQSWDALKTELSSSGSDDTVDVQVVGFSYSPTLGGVNAETVPGSGSSDSSSSSSGGSGDGQWSGDDYCNILPTGSNAITFHAVSNSSENGAMFKRAAFVKDNYIYQAVLLGLHAGKHYVLSRVSLQEHGEYLTKPGGFEIALDWTVVFH